MAIYEVHPRKDKRGVDLISDVLPFGRLWYETPDNAIVYAMHSSRSHDAVIRVYDESGNVIKTHQHKGDFREWSRFYGQPSGAEIAPQNKVRLKAQQAKNEVAEKRRGRQCDGPFEFC